MHQHIITETLVPLPSSPLTVFVKPTHCILQLTSAQILQRLMHVPKFMQSEQSHWHKWCVKLSTCVNLRRIRALVFKRFGARDYLLFCVCTEPSTIHNWDLWPIKLANHIHEFPITSMLFLQHWYSTKAPEMKRISLKKSRLDLTVSYTRVALTHVHNP